MTGLILSAVAPDALPWLLSQLPPDPLLIADPTGVVFEARANVLRWRAGIADDVFGPGSLSTRSHFRRMIFCEAPPREFVASMAARCDRMIVAVHRRLPSRMYCVWLLQGDGEVTVIDLDQRIVHEFPGRGGDAVVP